MSVYYSIVIPVKDEAENIESLLEEIEAVMTELPSASKKPWELIIVEDGSQDQSPQILRRLLQTKDYLRVLFFSKNFDIS